MLCFLFLNKVSPPCYAVSLCGRNHRQDCTTDCTSASWSLPEAKLPLRPRCVSELCPHAGRCCRRCPAKPCCSGKAVTHKHNAFLGSPQHRRLPRQVGSPGRLSRQHPVGSSADTPLLGSSPWLAALRVTVNGAKDKLFLQGMYSYTVQGQPGAHFAGGRARFSLSLSLPWREGCWFPSCSLQQAQHPRKQPWQEV